MNKTLFLLFFSLCSLCYAYERPIVKDLISYTSRGNRINISWTPPLQCLKPIEGVKLYRSRKPIGSYYDIKDAEEKATLSITVSSYEDTVKDYNDYYYAVLCITDGKVYDIVLPSINSTINPVHLKLMEKIPTEPTESSKEKINLSYSRETPLPYIDFLKMNNKKNIKMSDKTLQKAKELSRAYTGKKTILEPYVFEEDLIINDQGDDYLLFEVLKDSFIQKRYSETIVSLKKLLGTNRSKSVTNRAYFYLGEAYYYNKDYPNATRAFLKIYDVYPQNARKWLDSSLDLLTIPKSKA